MKKLINKPWDYMFYENNNEFILSVSCGSVAIFDINLLLSEEEKKNYLEIGPNYIDELAKKIQLNPSAFSERNIQNFSI